MNDDDFNSLKAMMKLLEKEDKSKSSIAHAIAELIDYENKDMTEAQKSFISRSFSHYTRRGHNEAFARDFLSKPEQGSF